MAGRQRRLFRNSPADAPGRLKAEFTICSQQICLALKLTLYILGILLAITSPSEKITPLTSG
jgi:hypothetical protein